jgi:hypothetical protein
MAHRVSAAALHAARVVLKHYTLEAKPIEELPSGRIPNLEATEKCLAIVIDWMSNVFHVANVRPELRYWQERMHANTATAPQIAGFLQRMLDAFAMLPKESVQEARVVTTLETPLEFGSNKPEQHVISKPALEAARGIFYYYRVTSKKKDFAGDVSVHRVYVAKLIEMSLGLHRASEAIPILQRWKVAMDAGKATADDIKKCLRAVGIMLEQLPNFENIAEQTRLL